LKTLADNFKAQFNDHPERKWGGGVMGLKTVAKLEKRKKQLEVEKAKKEAAAKR
jgi:large subunit ribosomal protein L7Ae